MDKKKYLITSALKVTDTYASLSLCITGERFPVNDLPDLVWSMPLKLMWGSFKTKEGWGDWSYQGWSISGRSIYDYKEVARLIDAVLKRIEGSSYDPVDVWNRLVGSRMYTEVIFDHRLGQYVLVRDLRNPQWQLFNAVTAGPESDIIASALADSLEQARKAVSQYLIDHDPEGLQRWADNKFKMEERNRASSTDNFWHMTFTSKVEHIQHQKNHDPDIEKENAKSDV